MKFFSFVILVSCTVLAVNGASPKSKCPKVAEPKLKEGCVNREDKDANGCTSWTTHCVTSDPPRQTAEISVALPRVARAAKAKCPVKPKSQLGCTVDNVSTDPKGCPVWHLTCAGRRVARAAKAKCPVKPKGQFGCTVEHVSNDENGCKLWLVTCAGRRVARAAKGKCPDVKTPEVPAGCTLENGKDANGCPSWTIGCNSPNPPHHL